MMLKLKIQITSNFKVTKFRCLDLMNGSDSKVLDLENAILISNISEIVINFCSNLPEHWINDKVILKLYLL